MVETFRVRVLAYFPERYRRNVAADRSYDLAGAS